MEGLKGTASLATDQHGLRMRLVSDVYPGYSAFREGGGGGGGVKLESTFSFCTGCVCYANFGSTR